MTYYYAKEIVIGQPKDIARTNNKYNSYYLPANYGKLITRQWYSAITWKYICQIINRQNNSKKPMILKCSTTEMTNQGNLKEFIKRQE